MSYIKKISTTLAELFEWYRIGQVFEEKGVKKQEPRPKRKSYFSGKKRSLENGNCQR